MSDKITLYNITQEMENINSLLEESGGEITPILQEMINKTAAQLEEKCDNVVSYSRMQSDQLEMIAKRRKEIQELEKRVKKQIDNFKDYVIACMKTADLKKIESPFARITMRKPSKKLHVKEDIVPDKYIKHTPSIDTDLIRNSLNSGEELSFASYIDGKESVLIKMKG